MTARTMRVLALLTENAPLLEKYPFLLSNLAKLDCEYLANLAPEVGQKVLPPTRLTMAGTSVRATERATRTPNPTTIPIVRRKVIEVRESARKEMITVAPLVAMLSPAQVIDVSIPCCTEAPRTRSSLYLAMTKTL